ncbi:MAG: RNA polymerase sigma factor [Balneolaceae bacterium]|nr:RNA polymerase sigma factor [Balneolaceae bacterium]
MTEARQLEIFKNWLQQYKALLFKVVRAYAFSESGREDLFQEISIQVWRSIPNFRKESAVTTWIYRVALNTAIRWNQKEQKHQKRQQRLADYEHLLEKKEEKEDPRLDWLYEEISRLDEIDRSLCLLMLDGFSYREMSDILGISESNIGVKIHRIKKYLIEKSKEYDNHGI